MSESDGDVGGQARTRVSSDPGVQGSEVRAGVGAASTERSRRRFVAEAAAAGAIAWVTPVVLSQPALATGSVCGAAALLDWCTNAFPSGTGNFAATAIAAGSGTCASTPTGNQTNYQGISVSMAFTTGNGVTQRDTGTSVVPGVVGGSPAGRRFAMSKNGATDGTFCVVVITFSVPVRNLDFTLLDIDTGSGTCCAASEHYIDQMTVAAAATTGGSAVTPTTVQLGVPIGGGTQQTPLTVGGSYPTFIGSGCACDGNTTSNVRLFFNNQAVQQVTITYTSNHVGPPGQTTSTQQYVGISNMTWC